ncbi:hypothetical protein QFC22_006349, partial [Naganishia vaughanmartiniae]
IGITPSELGRLLTSYSEASDLVRIEVTTTIGFIPDHSQSHSDSGACDSGRPAPREQMPEQVISNEPRSPYARDFAYRHRRESRKESDDQPPPVGGTTPVAAPTVSDQDQSLVDAINLISRHVPEPQNDSSQRGSPNPETSSRPRSAQVNASSPDEAGPSQSSGMAALLSRIGPPVSGNSASYDTEVSDTEEEREEGEIVDELSRGTRRGCRGGIRVRRREQAQQRRTAALDELLNGA